MTGLLSVFSLLPVQALKKRDGGDGEAEEDSDPGGSGTTKADEHSQSLRDDGDSSHKDAERYHSYFLNIHI